MMERRRVLQIALIAVPWFALAVGTGTVAAVLWFGAAFGGPPEPIGTGFFSVVSWLMGYPMVPVTTAVALIALGSSYLVTSSTFWVGSASGLGYINAPAFFALTHAVNSIAVAILILKVRDYRRRRDLQLDDSQDEA